MPSACTPIWLLLPLVPRSSKVALRKSDEAKGGALDWAWVAAAADLGPCRIPLYVTSRMAATLLMPHRIGYAHRNDRTGDVNTRTKMLKLQM